MKYTKFYTVDCLTIKNHHFKMEFNFGFNLKSEALAKYKECKQKYPRLIVSLFTFHWNPITSKWVQKENECIQGINGGRPITKSLSQHSN